MGLPTVEKCCACLELKTGTLIIGAINLLAAIVGAVFSAIGLAGSAVLASGALNKYIDNGQQGGYQGSDAVNAAGTWGIIVTSILLIIYVLYVVVASMLIHGARKEKPGLMMPWIILTIFYMILAVVQIISYVVLGERWMSVLTPVFSLLITFYFFICIWSHRKQLIEGNELPKN